jgi:hypothetical protein
LPGFHKTWLKQRIVLQATCNRDILPATSSIPPMKKIPLTPKITVIAFILFCFIQTSFAQISDSVQQINLCAQLKRVKAVSAPFNKNELTKFDSIPKSPALLSAIKKATQLPFSEGECPSGENDEEFFADDFDTSGNSVYRIIRIAHPKGINNNIWTFLINTHDNHTWLITFVHNNNHPNCIEAKNAVLIQFHMPGNRHWYHSRTSEFKTSTTIKMSGDCWHESDGPKSINGLTETLVIQKDGTIAFY